MCNLIQTLHALNCGKESVQVGRLVSFDFTGHFLNQLLYSYFSVQLYFILLSDGICRGVSRVLDELPAERIGDMHVLHAISRTNATGADGNPFGMVYDVTVGFIVH